MIHRKDSENPETLVIIWCVVIVSVVNAFKKIQIPNATAPFLHAENLVGGPSVDRGIYIGERPLVGGELPIGMHEPLSRKEQ